MFDNNFQNTVPNQSTEINPYQDQYFGQNDKTPYREQMTVPMPQPMGGDVNEDSLYPLESSLATPGLSVPVGTNNSVYTNYAKGGEVKKSKKKSSKFPNLYPSLAEMIREQGGEEDTILAHINPLEAQILGLMANGGRVNPVTGLPQFGLFNKPGKWLKSNLGGGAGAILGNMILPGIGGVLGGALGGAAGSAVRGRKDYLQSGLRGGAIGAVLPTAASLLGAGASKAGMNGAGNFLSNYGAENAILPSLGLGGEGMPAGEGGSSLSNMITGREAAQSGAPAVKAAEKSWFDKLLQPKNLLTGAAVAGSFMNRPKQKTPEQIASEEKRYRNAARLSKEEIEADEAAEFLKKQANYRLRHNLMPGESLSAAPVYRKVNSPEEYRKNNRWLEYYNEPSFSGNPLMMKMGGPIKKTDPKELEMNNMNELSYEWPNFKPTFLAEIEHQKGINTGLEKKYDTELHNLREGYDAKSKGLNDINLNLMEMLSKYGQEHGVKGNMHGLYQNYKKGGATLPQMMIEEEEIEYPSGLGFYLKGHTGGQDDKRPMKLPEGSYIIDASTVSDLGDGNSEAGKKQLDALVSDGEYYMAPKTVSNMGKGNNNLGAKKLDEMVKNIRQHKRGGSAHLPPKAKSLASYMMR